MQAVLWPVKECHIQLTEKYMKENIKSGALKKLYKLKRSINLLGPQYKNRTKHVKKRHYLKLSSIYYAESPQSGCC